MTRKEMAAVENIIEAAARRARKQQEPEVSFAEPDVSASDGAAPAEVPSLKRLPDVTPHPPGPVEAAALAHASPIAEEARLLQSRLRAMASTRHVRCIGVVSPAPREGKTTVALGLATALARQPSQRVLLIEADLRRPALEYTLGIPQEAGLAEWLGGSASLSLRVVAPPGFSLISAGRVPVRNPELLGSRRMRELLKVVRQSFEFVIVDCPPLTPVADSLLLQDVVDGFLLVIRAGRSSRSVIARGLARLRPERLLGVIFNGDRLAARGYDSYDY
jgi:capsular exopolysaccharide synthesis family protein